MASEPSGSLVSAFLLLPVVFGYLIGSIPFGLLLTRAAGAGDIRAIGSGNIGATNVLRTGRKGLAALTLLLDGGKGAAAVFFSALFYVHVFAKDTGTIRGLVVWSCLAGVAAVAGHVFPVWLKFKGGKGVATALGVALMLSPTAGIGAMITWLLAAGISRTSSIGGIAAVVAAPVLATVLGVPMAPVITLALAAIAVLVVWRHRDNIRRLIAGTEPRIGRRP
ncbi:MAG TPA: glycerol-3-phosphate 1-O-acyltransferase PlsY [Alphaproteobacteria bacterium]|jgi:glycerol-3-phosphate acyltransferase PlsY|nr:glycerol-3-phosphate 1-O-acyltransferase PlsY [Alphaproteobacteria bacterium]